MNPYARLGIPADADDETIRAAYLAAIKRFPPERYPDRFTAISEAYHALQDEDARLRHLLFETDSGAASPMDIVSAHFAAGDRRRPPEMDVLKHFLRQCLKA